MTHRIHGTPLTAALAAAVLLAACTPTTKQKGAAGTVGHSEAAASPASAAPPAAASTVHDERVREIMQAKLTHANALLEAIALEDFAAVEQNARELSWLSELSAWEVTDSPQYGVLSERFRGIMVNLVRHAREANLAAVTDDHRQMTASCIECHAYLRAEGLVQELPGPET